MSKGYQRLHLRAPFKQDILFSDEDFVFKCSTLNISEGGVLLDQIPHFPLSEFVPMMLSVPQYPSFKNFDLLKLKTFSFELFPAKVIRVQGKIARKEGENYSYEDVFRSKIGISFTKVSDIEKKIIADYVEKFTGNLATLSMWIDLASNDEETLKKARILADILGYISAQKLADLRFEVHRDYKSLQWS